MAVKSKNSLSQALDHGHQRSLSTQRIKGGQGKKNFYQTTLVPPSSQSHFAKFKNFTPKNDAGFEHEFARLASSQNWVPGSQQFKKERTIAMRQEFICHFFSSQPTSFQTQAQSIAASRTPTQAQAIRTPSQATKTQSQPTKTQSQPRTQTKTQTVTPTQTDDGNVSDYSDDILDDDDYSSVLIPSTPIQPYDDVSDYSDDMLDDDDYSSVLVAATQQTCSSSQPTNTEEPANPTPEQELRGFQDLCSEVGLPRAATIPECKRALKTKLVNIVDLVDTRRTGKKVKIWTDFEAFKDYTLQPEHKIDREEAKAGPGYLAALLQNLGPPNKKRIGGNRSRSGGGNKTAGGFKHGKTRSGRVEKGH